MADKIAKDVAFRVPNSRVRYTSRVDKELNGKVKVVVLLGFGPAKAVIIPFGQFGGRAGELDQRGRFHEVQLARDHQGMERAAKLRRHHLLGVTGDQPLGPRSDPGSGADDGVWP